MQALLYLIFTLSGAAGLIYEMIWARYLALFVGHSAYAQLLVIAIFLGGMALGALWAGARSSRWRDPLKGYAAAELAAGLIGVFFHDIYQATTGFAYASVFPALGGGVLLTGAKWALAAALILPQSILLGATFPLMAAGVLRRWPRSPGRTLAFLYFTNSLGAAGGVLVAGFYLVALAGLPGTVLVAAIINLVVALAAISIARRSPASARLQIDETPAAPIAAPSSAGRGGDIGSAALVRLLLAVSFGTAVASFAYEIGWLRMLALVLGSATHSFELMLSAFILGLALGAFWVRRRADTWGRPLRALGIVQCAMGLAALATLFLYGASFWWMAGLIQTFGPTDPGYAGFTIARYGICLAIMLPATFCAGMTLPLITRTLLVAGAGEPVIGQVYGANTFGSIVGVGLAGLALLPWIGLRNLILVGGALDMLIGVALLYLQAGRRPLVRRRLGHASLAATAAAVLLVLAAGDLDRRLMRSGVYRTGVIGDLGATEELFYADGRTATVSVHQIPEARHIMISTNGKIDASLSRLWLEGCTDSTPRWPLASDGATQTLAPLITLAHAVEPRRAAVIGHGSGMSGHFLLTDRRLEAVTTVEIEPAMVRGSRAFYPANRRVFDDPRSEIVIEDARTFFAANQVKYDVILSEPSHPWVSGVASLFTSEFYRLIRNSLSERGVFGQWLHLYTIDDALVLSVLAAIDRNFESYELFLTNRKDMLLVASAGPTLRSPDWSIVTEGEAAADLCHALPIRPWALEAARLTNAPALRPLLRTSARPNSDFYPILDLLAERARYLQTAATGFLALSQERFAAPLLGRRFDGEADAAPPLPGIPRVEALALGAALRDTAAIPVRALAPAGYDAARYRVGLWRELLSSDRPPVDWRMWLANLRVIDADLNGGRAGSDDASFYDPVFAYLDRFDAPAAARAVVRFRHGLSTWDFASAAATADELLASAAHEDRWIAPGDLFEGALTARLMVGDVAGAEAMRDSLAKFRPPGWDLRIGLLEAQLEAAGGGGRLSISVFGDR